LLFIPVSQERRPISGRPLGREKEKRQKVFMTKSGIPVLLYHHLFTEESHNEKYAVSSLAFERHIRYLKEHGFKGICVEEFLTGTDGDVGSSKNIAITFDDGDYSNYSTAFPILKKYGFRATFFITTAWIGTDGYMDMSQIRELYEAGMAIGSHGVRHRFLSDLDDMELGNELALSKATLEDGLGCGIKAISLPGGFGSERVLKAARREGYEAVYTSVPGLNSLKSNKWTLNRFVVTQSTSLERFTAMANGDMRLVVRDRGIHCMKSAAKKVLGSKLYYSVWSRFFRQVG